MVRPPRASRLEDDGSSVVRQRGSHRQFNHASKPGLVTVAGKPGDDVAPGTLNSILKQVRFCMKSGAVWTQQLLIARRSSIAR
ncbi:MAG: type II toxin-antitoxin system HicA family toxin [Vicinamibacterales bacterium]